LNISIFGLGYVGCVSLGCLAGKDHCVIGVDINDDKIDAINRGECPIIEKDIDSFISHQHQRGKIKATRDGINAVKSTDVSLICVGTPSTPNGHLNVDAIFKVAEEIGKGIKEKNGFHAVAIRSTVLLGTNEKVAEIIEKFSGRRRDEEFAVVSNPEFLREGSAVSDYFSPPYTLIGSANSKAIQIFKQIYDSIDAPIIVTDIRIAELIKYVNNSFHATKIVFANEVGNICKKVGIDSHKLMEIFCLDTKLNISPYYFKPGFAYGGSCLPKDLKALNTIAHDNYVETPLLNSIITSNENQKKIVYDQIIHMKKNKIGFFGLSFKAGTDDLRNSPILDIIERLLGKGYDIRIYDKNVHFSQLMGANKEYILQKIPFISRFVTDNPYQVIAHSEIIVIVYRSSEFEKLFDKVPTDKIIFDLANLNISNKNRFQKYIGIAW
jgi:GDP-mannose 6-dehydrogenase